MKRLWAPWRIEYIEGEMEDEGCLFCKAIEDNDDLARLIIHRGQHSFALLNKYPYIGGHMLIAPLKHVEGMDNLDDEEKLDLLNLTIHATGALKRAMKPHGFNVGVNIGKVAGAGVPDHVHIHVVPRWTGDTNMVPVLGEVRIINEHLTRTWEKIRKHW